MLFANSRSARLQPVTPIRRDAIASAIAAVPKGPAPEVPGACRIEIPDRVRAGNGTKKAERE
jgi:hypothetical protein